MLSPRGSELIDQLQSQASPRAQGSLTGDGVGKALTVEGSGQDILPNESQAVIIIH